jgi:type VI secretion system FHA domain protein
MAGHYQPPRAAFEPPPGPPSAEPLSIPPDYDPMAPDVASTPPRFAPALRSDAARPVFEPAAPSGDSKPVLPPVPRPSTRGSATAPRPAPPNAPPATPPVESKEDANVAPSARRADGDLAAVLAGVGLAHVQVTPELAENFGRILKVVVAGVMDLLRARQQVKDELRMRQTQFKPADNNPLKFSANVDDALHNLLVKRNPAYLQPVEAFADAFDDLRDHQLAMLAGLRVAFEAMLADFDADRLEEQFDRRFKKGALLSVPAKLRYWDSYREKTSQLLLDVDGAFRKWFGEEFVKAYEEQLERLETERQQRNP